MRFYNGLKLAGMVCACAVIMTVSPFTADASVAAPSNEAELIVKVDETGVPVYDGQDANTEVIAQAVQGAVPVYDVLENGTEEQVQMSKRQQVVDYALQFVGGRYRAGGSDPRTGTDCSGFTKFVMQHGIGVNLQRSSGLQATQGRQVSAEEMQAGDLIFYSKGGRINHVALYIGNGQVVHASTEKTGIKLSNWNYRTPTKIVSVLG